MTASRLSRLAPRASHRVHLLLAASLWSAVGAVLLGFGARWALQGAGRPEGELLVGAGVALGLLKSRLVLDRTAARITARILERGDDRCLGGFLSWKSWLLVGGMSAAGRLLRGGLLAPAAVGTLYVAIGTGLAVSSRVAWRRWRRPPSA